MTQMIMMVYVITHLEPDILECEVKWALKSITTNKASGSDGIPVKLFQILKDDTVKVLHSICQQIWKTQQWPQDWKRSVFIPIPKKGNAKECSNYHTIALISHASKVMLKILQARLQQYVNCELPDIQTVASLPACRFLWRQIRWSGIPSLGEFSAVCCDPHKGFGLNKAKVNVFLELSCFFHDPADVGNLISGSSAFSKSSLNVWKFSVHILLKPGLENFEHHFASV